MLNSRLEKRREIISAIVLTEEKEKQTSSQNEINSPKNLNSQNDKESFAVDSQIENDFNKDSNNNSNFTQSQRFQSRSSNRLSGLKKLESLYKTIKDDDENFFSNKKSNSKCKSQNYFRSNKKNSLNKNNLKILR